MIEVLLALMFLSQSGAPDQKTLARPNVWNVYWRLASDSSGQIGTVPVLAWAGADLPVRGVGYSAPPEIAEVAAIEERYRHARLVRDRSLFDKILSPEYYETDADGHRRDKPAAIAFAMDETVGPFNDSPVTARAADNVVVLTGEEGAAPNGFAGRALFTHVYSRGRDGDWQLLSVTLVRQ